MSVSPKVIYVYDDFSFDAPMRIRTDSFGLPSSPHGMMNMMPEPGKRSFMIWPVCAG